MKIHNFFLFLFLIACSAEPNENDLNKTIKTFLELRFRSTYDKNLAQFKEYELFQLSCKQNRVKCNKVLGLLKEKKPEFYHTLMNSN